MEIKLEQTLPFCPSGGGSWGPPGSWGSEENQIKYPDLDNGTVTFSCQM